MDSLHKASKTLVNLLTWLQIRDDERELLQLWLLLLLDEPPHSFKDSWLMQSLSVDDLCHCLVWNLVLFLVVALAHISIELPDVDAIVLSS